MKISLNQVTNDFSHEVLLYAIMLLTRKENMSLSNRPRMFTRKNRPGETADKSVKIFFHPNSSIEQDGDEKSSDDINADDDDDLDDICLGKTKRTPLLFVYQNGW